MSSAHVIYIPLIVFAGMVLGFVLGRRAAIAEQADAKRRLEGRDDRLAKLQKRLAKVKRKAND
jgi:hypothetical protein